jgi:hypothetical protein
LDLHITEISPLDMTSCCYYLQEEDIRNEHVTSVQDVRGFYVTKCPGSIDKTSISAANDATMQGEALPGSTEDTPPPPRSPVPHADSLCFSVDHASQVSPATKKTQETPENHASKIQNNLKHASCMN